MDYFITIKMDGTSASYVWEEDTWLVCSRNLALSPPSAYPLKKPAPGKESTFSYPTSEYLALFPPPSDDHRYEYCPYHLIARKYRLAERLQQLAASGHPPVGLQGEICGPRLQKNLLELKQMELFVFNVVDLASRSTYSYDHSLRVLALLNQFEPEAPPVQLVPLVEQGSLFPYHSVSELEQLSRGLYPNTKNFREGIVVRFVEKGQPFVSRSFKVINVDYLLKHDS